ncbi:hypothetical protein GOODEAATRI_002417 [Goodea atripinnis]|uniref:Uncharacterized protein n=1 Tax=Goodea atripinnis TaxID=208336 RepID=A0ABV0PAR5_9TELE
MSGPYKDVSLQPFHLCSGSHPPSHSIAAQEEQVYLWRASRTPNLISSTLSSDELNVATLSGKVADFPKAILLSQRIYFFWFSFVLTKHFLPETIILNKHKSGKTSLGPIKPKAPAGI